MTTSILGTDDNYAFAIINCPDCGGPKSTADTGCSRNYCTCYCKGEERCYYFCMNCRADITHDEAYAIVCDKKAAVDFRGRYQTMKFYRVQVLITPEAVKMNGKEHCLCCGKTGNQGHCLGCGKIYPLVVWPFPLKGNEPCCRF